MGHVVDDLSRYAFGDVRSRQLRDVRRKSRQIDQTLWAVAKAVWGGKVDSDPVFTCLVLREKGVSAEYVIRI